MEDQLNTEDREPTPTHYTRRCDECGELFTTRSKHEYTCSSVCYRLQHNDFGIIEESEPDEPEDDLA